MYLHPGAELLDHGVGTDIRLRFSQVLTGSPTYTTDSNVVESPWVSTLTVYMVRLQNRVLFVFP